MFDRIYVKVEAGDHIFDVFPRGVVNMLDYEVGSHVSFVGEWTLFDYNNSWPPHNISDAVDPAIAKQERLREVVAARSEDLDRSVRLNQIETIENPLGMRFVPVPGTKILMSIWETRVQDFRAFRSDTVGVADHPVVNVSWEDAQAFCQWLSRREGKTYRLPTDHEWSLAVGIGDWESAKVSPADKDGKIEGVYPWGTTWPPPNGVGNYNSILNCDRFIGTAPVGSFAANQLGLFDLGGNVWEWCEDWYDSDQTLRVLRGGSWGLGTEFALRSSYRCRVAPTRRCDGDGFRVVLELGSGG
jgi:formylglycine-generating enzyme required for sulfatase activity